MKDDRLEKEFEKYFDGVNISDDILADAKASVKPKRKTMPKIVKYISIAASIVLGFTVAVTVMLRTGFIETAPNNGTLDGGNSSSPAPGDGEGNNNLFIYTDSDLVQSYQSAYSVSSLNSSLKFIEDFAYAYNATVETCQAGYLDEKLALVTAEVSILNGLSRDETTVFVEFTDANQIYNGLADYYDGKVYRYYGAQYYLTKTTAQNGEPEYKLYISYRGIKYYFSVRSSDYYAYEKYLDLVIGK